MTSLDNLKGLKIELIDERGDGQNETFFYETGIEAFVNNVRPRDGSTHETGAKSAMTRVFNEYALYNKTK